MALRLAWLGSEAEADLVRWDGGGIDRGADQGVAVYIALETDPDAAIVLSLVLLAVSIMVLASLRDKWINPKAA